MLARSHGLASCRHTKTALSMVSRKASSTVAAADFVSLGGSGRNNPPWWPVGPLSVTSHPKPDWKYGEGANDNRHSLSFNHIEIDPFTKGRPMMHNYSLLISGIAPRPIGLISALSKDGKPNLAPFSYFQVVDHDPPVFVVGFSGRGGSSKDTLRNLAETGECVINTVSEHMIEAVNATSLDAPHDQSEWEISGLHPTPSSEVKPPRVKESIFAVEGRLCKVVDFKTSRPSQGHGKLAIIEGTNFWVREDAIDEKRSHIDLEVLKPLGQLGDISYSRTGDTFQIARSSWKKEMENPESGLEELMSRQTSNTDDQSSAPSAIATSG